MTEFIFRDVSEPASSPSVDELRKVFAQNLSRLLDLIPGDRKQAAGTLGVPYKWLWRVATKGITRVDDRHRPHLQKVAKYFSVPIANDFWQPELFYRLITDPSFRKRFLESLRRLYEEAASKLKEIDTGLIDKLRPFEEITLVTELNPTTPERSVMTTMDKYEWLIATGRYEHLKPLAEAFAGTVDAAFQAECDENTAKNAQTG